MGYHRNNGRGGDGCIPNCVPACAAPGPPRVMMPVTKQNMSPILVLFVFFACGVLMWKLINWLPPRLREPTMIITATAAIYAVSFFLVGMFAVYMFVHLVGKYSHMLPQGFYYPVLILAIAMLIFVPALVYFVRLFAVALRDTFRAQRVWLAGPGGAASGLPPGSRAAGRQGGGDHPLLRARTACGAAGGA